MSVRAESSIGVGRPVADVFAYVSDIRNWPSWQGEIVEAWQTSDGPIGVGTTAKLDIHFLGRRMEADIEVTEYEPGRSYAVRTRSAPVPFTARVACDPEDGGTRITYRGLFEPSGFFKLAEPVLERIGQRQADSEMHTLKELLEAQAPAPAGR